MGVGANAWSDTVPQDEPLIVRAWRCQPSAERRVAGLLVAQYDTLIPFILELEADIIFFTESPTWWEIRKRVFEIHYQIQKLTIEIDDVEIAVYAANRAWMGQAKDAIEREVISMDAEYCYQREFVNSP
jgi:hypothetical protein